MFNSEKILVIFSTQRSGSTMVCDDIAGTKILGTPTEYLQKFLNKKNYLTKDRFEEIAALIESKARTPNGVVSIKIMANQIFPFTRLVSEIYYSNETPYQKVFIDLFSKAQFLRVKRLDKVSQAVSRLMARVTKNYHSAVIEGDDELTKIVGSKISQAERAEVYEAYDYNLITQEIEKIEKEEKFLDELIVQLKLDVDNVIYEDVVANRDYIYRVANKFGEFNAKLGVRRLKKIGGDVSKVWIDRYKSEIEKK